MAKRTANTATPTSDYTALVAEAAYYKAERRGFEPGYEMTDWLEAEREIEGILEKPKARTGPVKAASKAGKPKKSSSN
jgi:hypothetical protein